MEKLASCPDLVAGTISWLAPFPGPFPRLRKSAASLGSGLQLLKPEPLTNNYRNGMHLIRRQQTKAADEFAMRYRDDVLHVKDARLQESDRNSDFEIGSACARGVGDNRSEHTIVGSSRRNAHNQAWPDLCDQTEVDEPHFTAERIGHHQPLVRRDRETTPQRR